MRSAARASGQRAVDRTCVRHGGRDAAGDPVTGCGSHAPKPSGAATPRDTSAAMSACGVTRTAANVPVDIQIARGQVSCSTALAIERDYAKAILSGKVPGTGGGAPVQVQGWTCQGFTTPVVLKTGQASKCVDGSTEILAILLAPACPRR